MSAAHPPVLGDGIGLRSGQVAAAAGVNVETLRYYERRGLLAEPHRSSGGHRLYDASSVTTLRVIKAAQRLGFTLEEVAELLEVGRHRHRPRGVQPGDAGLQARARAKLAEVEERITDLVAIRDNLQAALTAAFAGAVFALAVGLATVAAVVVRRRRGRAAACAADAPGPVAVELGQRPDTAEYSVP